LRRTAEIAEDELRARFAPLLERAFADLSHEGFAREVSSAHCALDMRYRGQSYEIAVPFAPGFEEHFHRAHRQMYGYANPARATEIVHLRVKAIGRTDKPLLPRCDATPRALPQPSAVRPARFRGRNLPTPIYHREALVPGMGGHGPAIVASAQSTSAIPPGFAFAIDPVGTLVATRTESRRAKTRSAPKEPHAT
jgi:N-methylhydantoinase A